MWWLGELVEGWDQKSWGLGESLEEATSNNTWRFVAGRSLMIHRYLFDGFLHVSILGYLVTKFTNGNIIGIIGISHQKRCHQLESGGHHLKSTSFQRHSNVIPTSFQRHWWILGSCFVSSFWSFLPWSLRMGLIWTKKKLGMIYITIMGLIWISLIMGLIWTFLKKWPHTLIDGIPPLALVIECYRESTRE